MTVNFDDLKQKVSSYLSVPEVEFIEKVYYKALAAHKGQYRRSGEPYIIHPIAVASILTQVYADSVTIAAALLHDVEEDCNVTKEEITGLFGEEVARLVDGVTNLTKADFRGHSAREYGNKRKIILGIALDPRIPIIKLADRMHNMMTLQYQSKEKIVSKANETLTFYVPLARYLGLNTWASRLEDLSFYYLQKEDYLKTKKIVNGYIFDNRHIIKQLLCDVYHLLNQEGLPLIIKTQIKNIYGVYSQLKASEKFNNGESIQDIYDLVAIKLLMEQVSDCYQVRERLNGLYSSCNLNYDFLNHPKKNMYSALHATFIDNNNFLFQAQIQTQEKEKINEYGLAAFFELAGGEAITEMAKTLKDRYHFQDSIKELGTLVDNRRFVKQVQEKMLKETINVYDSTGKMITIASGAHLIDFFYLFGSSYAEMVESGNINGVKASFSTPLKNGDKIDAILRPISLGSSEDLLEAATLPITKTKIRRGMKKYGRV